MIYFMQTLCLKLYGAWIYISSTGRSSMQPRKKYSVQYLIEIFYHFFKIVVQPTQLQHSRIIYLYIRTVPVLIKKILKKNFDAWFQRVSPMN